MNAPEIVHGLHAVQAVLAKETSWAAPLKDQVQV